MKHIYRNAIICLLIGASFIGCNKKMDNQNPSVSMLTEEGFTTGENHLFIGTTVKFGFNAFPNAATNSKLVKFQVFVAKPGQDWVYDTTYFLNNEDSFRAEGEYTFIELGDWRIAGRVFDASNNWSETFINIHVQEDMEEPFVWQQIGLDSVSGFGDYGLLWLDSKVVDSVAIALDTISLLPVDDSISLYLFDQSKWDEIDTYDGKDALFKDIKKNPKNYKNNKISTYNIFAAKEAATYDEVIAVMNEKEDGENLLLLISNSYSETYGDNGLRHLTVNGKLK